MLLGQPVRQIGFGVASVRDFATKHSETYGSGPFLIVEGAEVTGQYRGEQTTFSMDVAFGQWGELQVEIMHQNTPGPGLVHDKFPEGSDEEGVHHFCSIVDDLERSMATFHDAGYEVLFSAVMPLGTKVVMFDTLEQLGYFTEMYENTDEIGWLYDGVRKAADGFDGSNPIRAFADHMPAELQIKS